MTVPELELGELAGQEDSQEGPRGACPLALPVLCQHSIQLSLPSGLCRLLLREAELRH